VSSSAIVAAIERLDATLTRLVDENRRAREVSQWVRWILVCIALLVALDTAALFFGWIKISLGT
jgi:hypothetical protein